ncbi:acyl-CoA carboxylase subunit beta [Corynebacterium sp. 4HC-13]|uniref:acyl-CoA carboxylase subunit beta n=1 Tax=Corynebacterium anserum TaxID=2684406 RepID=UPI001639FC34|nr:carboxyl transferase domain-containing protein [Corynebacterium anserum]MBC2682131.1 acyl-CoA carboxylase subunit beta [Corynebacterium anserum]
MTTADTSTTAGKIADLKQRLADARTPVGEDAVRATHDAGRFTAHERVEALLDKGSFVEIDALVRHRATAFKLDKSRPLTDGVVTGHGTIDGRPVCIFSQDSTIFDGQLGEATGEKMVKVLELAMKSGTPVIGLYDGTGVRAKEGIVTLEMFSRIYRLQAQASGVVPHIAVVLGKVSGSQSHGVALSDVVINVAGQSGVCMHASEERSSVSDATSGLSHITATDEQSALDLAAELLTYLPSNNRAITPEAESTAARDGHSLDVAIPDARDEAFDITQIIAEVVDNDSLLELQPVHAPNICTCFARIDGRSVGIIANQPTEKGGQLDADAAEKAARFIRLCNTYNLPLISFVDAPDFAPDTDGPGAVRRTAKLFSASADASVGKIAVIVRRAFGSAYLAMGAKRMGTDLVFAWPTAQIAVSDAVALSEITGVDAAQLEEDIVNPYAAAERGLVDAVIAPSHTRKQLIEGLRLLERKVEDGYPRKNNNIQL